MLADVEEFHVVELAGGVTELGEELGGFGGVLGAVQEHVRDGRAQRPPVAGVWVSCERAIEVYARSRPARKARTSACRGIQPAATLATLSGRKRT